MDRTRADNGSIVIGWLTKLAVAIAIVGLTLFDTLSIGAARLGGKDDANTAAEAAAQDYRSSHNVDQAYQAALETLPSDTESIPAKTFVIQSDGTVTLILDRKVNTLVARHIGFLKKYTLAVEHGESTPPTP
jgi:hypothetical protein